MVSSRIVAEGWSFRVAALFERPRLMGMGCAWVSNAIGVGCTRP